MYYIIRKNNKNVSYFKHYLPFSQHQITKISSIVALGYLEGLYDTNLAAPIP